MYLVGLNSFSKVIIVADTGKFEGVEDSKYTDIIGVLLDVVFNIVDLQGR